VNCAKVDDDGSPLTGSAPGDEGFAECTYKDAGICTYFAGVRYSCNKFPWIQYLVNRRMARSPPDRAPVHRACPRPRTSGRTRPRRLRLRLRLRLPLLRLLPHLRRRRRQQSARPHLKPRR
jgi:hypothetical protein